jgi:UDP-N-acetylmuramate--alanine ligase
MKHAIQHIHFVGIGGSGMSPIAEILHALGYRVSGSDQSDSAVTRRLARLGLTVYIGHAAAHIAGAQAVVTSTAVQADNPEVQAARAQRVPVVARAVLLAELMTASAASPSPAPTARPPPPRWSPACWPKPASIRPSSSVAS